MDAMDLRALQRQAGAILADEGPAAAGRLFREAAAAAGEPQQAYRVALDGGMWLVSRGCLEEALTLLDAASQHLHALPAPARRQQQAVLAELAARAMAGCGRPGEALAAVDDALEAASPRLRPRLEHRRAVILHQLGRLDEAEAMLAELAAAQPDNPRIQVDLTAVRLSQATRGGRPDLQQLTGWCQQLEELLRSMPIFYVQAARLLARCYQLAGRTADARQLWREIAQRAEPRVHRDAVAEARLQLGKE